MATRQLLRIKTITEYHRVMGLPKPEHPLISVINLESVKHMPGDNPISLVFDFYSISLKRDFNAKIKYGQQEYDFDEGIMFFISPGQVFGIEVNKDAVLKRSGWLLLIHPDFLWNTQSAKTIKKYEYFNYSVHEALFLSEKEEITITGMLQNIEQEYHTNIDKFSQNLIIAQLELLLTYAEQILSSSVYNPKNHQP